MSMESMHDKLKKRRAGRAGKGWKAREGPNKIRILPPKSQFIGNYDKLEDLSISYKVHWFNVEGRQTEVSRCLDELKQACPACIAWRAYKKSTDPGLAELAKSVRASEQYLFNILDHANFQAGIQAYPANYTVWDKIMEIAANPSWGYVVDPSNGVDFIVNLTPGNRSKTGHNTYSVTPEPQRTNVLPILDGLVDAQGQPVDWKSQLDNLEAQITEPKSAEEISKLLEAMGFPPVGTSAARPVAYAGAAPVPVAAAPAAVPMAAPVPAAAPAAPAVSIPGAVPAPAAVPLAAPVAAPAAAPAVPVVPVPTAAPVAVPIAQPEAPRADVASVMPGAPTVSAYPQPAATAASVHYDPGPQYTPKVADHQRPDGAPRCFGDYNPQQHRCQPCRMVADCQIHMLCIED